MPDGSSSAAPVIRPGPSDLRMAAGPDGRGAFSDASVAATGSGAVLRPVISLRRLEAQGVESTACGCPLEPLDKRRRPGKSKAKLAAPVAARPDKWRTMFAPSLRCINALTQCAVVILGRWKASSGARTSIRSWPAGCPSGRFVGPRSRKAAAVGRAQRTAAPGAAIAVADCRNDAARTDVRDAPGGQRHLSVAGGF